jgi:hypothetical protein
MGLTSTVPGALNALKGHMQTVKANNPGLNAAVYVGQAIGTSVADNFMSIGRPDGTGGIVTNYRSGWRGAASVQPVSRTEDYSILCVIRTYAATIDVPARYSDAFTLLNGLMVELANDIKAGGALGSGDWGVGVVDNPAVGKFGGQGVGVALEFTVDVRNVIIRNV